MNLETFKFTNTKSYGNVMTYLKGDIMSEEKNMQGQVEGLEDVQEADQKEGVPLTEAVTQQIMDTIQGHPHKWVEMKIKWPGGQKQSFHLRGDDSTGTLQKLQEILKKGNAWVVYQAGGHDEEE